MNLKDLENLEPAKFAKHSKNMKYHKIMKHVNLFTMANSNPQLLAPVVAVSQDARAIVLAIPLRSSA